MAYSETTDLMLGSIPLPAYLAPADYIKDADDEIDSFIGKIYETPLDVTEDGPMQRPARLLIKRLSRYLATGRIILALSAPEEKNAINAYGWQLLREAKSALHEIADGSIELEGALKVRRDAKPEPIKGPLISNVDSESAVEAFQDRIINPDYFYPSYYGRWTDPDRLTY